MNPCMHGLIDEWTDGWMDAGRKNLIRTNHIQITQYSVLRLAVPSARTDLLGLIAS